MSCLWLGIDVGTTSVKLALVDPKSKSTVDIQSLHTDSVLPPDVPKAHLQSVTAIFSAVVKCLELFEVSLLKRVEHITVTGQKHGLVFWNAIEQRSHLLSLDCSHLFSWLDGRCEDTFLKSLRGANSDVATGYGCATMLWLHRHQSELLHHYKRAGTIMDCLVDHLVSPSASSPVLMSKQNARCWGFFSFEKDDWDRENLLLNDFPMHFLPNLKECSVEAGKLACDLGNVSKGASVYVASGDLQASVKAALLPHLSASTLSNKYAYLSVSTSAQLAIVTNKVINDGNKIIRCDPYEKNSFIALAAALNGGNVLAALVDLVRNSLDVFSNGCNMDNDEMWSKLLDLVKDYKEWEHECPIIDPAMFGERHRPNDRCTISSITTSNFRVAHLFIGLCKGIMTNLAAMMDLSKLDVEYIVATGSCLKRIPVLRQMANDVFGLPIVLNEGDDDVAPVGSVYLVHDTL